MHLLAPAKINLHLRVGARDASGFHRLVSWLCTVGLCDTLTIHRGDQPGCRLTCDDPNLPTDATNLVFRAAESLRNLVPDAPGADIFLQKRIPISAGLGGGSSDAARTLLALDRIWDLSLPAQQLTGLAAQLGSDVPFFLHGPSSVCTGRGEKVCPIAAPSAKWALLILPGMPLSTAQVYRKFDDSRLKSADWDLQPPWQEWAGLTAGPLLSRLVNDLEPAAFALAPELGRLRGALEQALSRVIRMTGSGSTLFTLFDARDPAAASAQSVQAHFSLRTVVAELGPRIDDELSDSAARA